MTDESFQRAAPRRPFPTGDGHIWEIVIALLCVALVFYSWMKQPGLEMPLLISAGFVVVVLAFKRPSVPCIMFVCFSFLRIHEAFPVLSPLRIPQLLAQLILIVTFWHLVLMRSIRPYWSRELTAFAVFFTFCTASIVTSSGRDTSFLFWSDSFSKVALMTLLIAWCTRKAADFQLAGQTIVLAGIAVSCVAIYNKVHGIGLVEGTRVTIGRDVGSVLGDPNDLALALLFPLSFAGALVVARTNLLNRFYGLVGFGFVVAAIICTQSRGGLLGLATVTAVIGSRYVKNKMLVGIIGVCAMVLLYAVAGISGRSSGGAAEQGIDESSEGRLIAWRTAWNMVKAHPLLGVGLNTFPLNYYFYTPEWDGHEHAVHSTWFGVLAETGFLGFTSFITMIGMLIRLSLRCLSVAQGHGVDPRFSTAALALTSGLAGFCVSGTFLTQGLSWPIYVTLALTVALARALSEPRDPGSEVPVAGPFLPVATGIGERA
ncbi:putative membrane protein [Azorhizobium caulinodans ORS 571]|uniref:Putative membrane protein n=1 Tax=Azorhizobium caulinodans (strain ATCC 43989 / DSM 5975 / JCM 20966 / LMG 6465 / NBRC 14845 / NCIMB 13405 / ORS 571) TaxID=438753 RepID=A8HZX0_AZOC5|nr:O-antigen ligase family protein [Azorhizobium caulinodans]BAF90635.1 putative membrane protein [Azorhizobium caulinodans ORS 571]